VDVAVVDAGAGEASAALEALGVRTATGFEGVVFGGLEVDRLTILGGDRDTGLNTLDLVRPRSARYRSEAAGRSLRAPLRGREVSVLGPEDFVLFKLLSSRARDVEDARSVIRRNGDRLDRALLEREVARLSIEIPEHDTRARWAEASA
jgi:hypothetical protein